jgi:hypothetical protein
LTRAFFFFYVVRTMVAVQRGMIGPVPYLTTYFFFSFFVLHNRNSMKLSPSLYAL